MAHRTSRLIPALKTSCSMKRFLLCLAMVLAASEKLDRRYLPPPSAKFSGGNPEDLQVPFEFIKETSQIKNSFNYLKEYITKTSTQQHISGIAPDGSIDLSNIENRNNNEFYKETQARQYAANANIMQESINTHRNSGRNKVNETTPITDLKNQRPTNFNTFVLSSPSKPHSSSGARRKIASMSTKPHPERSQTKPDKKAVILNYHNVITPEGFSYSYNTSNEISANESGTANNGVRAKGSYSYKGDDGKIYKVVYTADENGFRPYGDHLPTPLPVSEAIQHLIEKAAREKEVGISDDGSYDEAKYGYKKYQGAMEQYHPELQGFTNIKRNQYSDYQKQKIGARGVHKKPFSSKIIGAEFNTGTSSSERLKDNSIVILAQGTATFKSADDPEIVFQTEYVSSRPEIINGYPNERNPYTFTQGKLFDSKVKEDDKDLKKPVDLYNNSNKNKQNNIVHDHSQNTLYLGNRNSNQKPELLHINQHVNSIKQAQVNTPIQNLAYFKNNVPVLITKSDNNNLRIVPVNELHNIGYIYVTPTTKFEETAYQNMNNEKFPFNSDQELAIGDDDIITISVPLNTSNVSNSNTLPTPTTTDQYTTVNIMKNIKDANREFDYLDSSKIPLYFVDSTTMPSNINIDHNETLEMGLQPSIAPGFSHTLSEVYTYTMPQQSGAFENNNKSKNVPLNQDYSADYSDVTSEFYGANINLDPLLKNNLGVSSKGKLDIENGYDAADVDIHQSNTRPLKAINNEEHYSGVISRVTTTERIIGEDFSGPKRAQFYNPITGYHY